MSNQGPDEAVKTLPATTASLSPRPAQVEYASISELFARFVDLFLGSGGAIVSPCGHRILVFDHHFFHLAAITVAGQIRLFMKDEKQTIIATTEGFGKYEVANGGSRAKHLSSARETLCTPDEVWENNPQVTAKWVYVKEWDSKPYPFSIVLVTDRPEEGGIIVPVSSFPCKRNDAKKWRGGTLIYPKNTTAAR
jgi:hypothetical protein